MFGTLYKGRYNILLMGIFATYCGFIYNELFAVHMEIFGDTAWCSGEMTHDEHCLQTTGVDGATALQKWTRTNMDQPLGGIKAAWDPKTGSTGEEVVWEPYPFGMDPGWGHTANKLNSVNSFKMKFAIVAGVIQMVAGVCCKLMNTLYFKDELTMYYVYIPEMVFINSIFGYLVMLIILKWTTNWDTTYVLNNEQVVSIPQRYCKDDLSNLPCWTPPFWYNRATIPGYGAQLAQMPDDMWCMGGGMATAGCALYKYKDQLICEADTYTVNKYLDPEQFNGKLCRDGIAASGDIGGCALWKQSPPSLLDSLIKMFMEIGSVPVENQLLPGQGMLQVLLILVAFFSVPILLFPKPYILKWRHEAQQHTQLHDDEESHDHGGGGGHGGHGEFEFGEEMVHQMIHTIECEPRRCARPRVGAREGWGECWREEGMLGGGGDTDGERGRAGTCWGASPIRPRICGCGRCRWRTRSCRRCSGRRRWWTSASRAATRS